MALFGRTILIMVIKRIALILVFIQIAILSLNARCDAKGEDKMKENKIVLPTFEFKGKVSVEEALYKRRSIRKFNNEPISIMELSKLLWAAYGVTTADGRKTTPSAGATYPLEIYVVATKVDKLKTGLYKYQSDSHSLLLLRDKDISNQVAEATYQVEMCRSAPVIFIITAAVERTLSVYGERGMRYIFMEAGHSAQNLSLEGVTLNIGSVLVGAFDDDRLKKVLNLPEGEIPLYIIPAGKTERYKRESSP